VLDAATLFPASLRDTLLLSVEYDVFLPKWSTETIEELARSLVRTSRMTQVKSERLQRTLNDSFVGATVEPSPALQSTLTNHPKDRHVLAAAIASKAEVIVTPNLRDFGEDALSPYGIRAVSPDDFLLRLLEIDADTMHVVIDLQWQALRRPPLNRDQVLDALGKIAPKFAEAMRTPRD
jgi:predicted nucleic acid-binding protein